MYTFSLSEKLHKFQHEILLMGAEEFFNYMAYDMLKDEKFRQKIQLELSKEQNVSTRHAQIKNMFRSLAGGTN